MRPVFSYRPSIQRETLEQIILKRLHYKKLNRFIDEAVKEKIQREMPSPGKGNADALVRKLSKVVYEHNGWKFDEVTPKLKKEIDRRAKAVETGKAKAVRWTGSIDDLLGKK
jgi:hypothetical protein